LIHLIHKTLILSFDSQDITAAWRRFSEESDQETMPAQTAATDHFELNKG
jgi:hypothetical protein